MALICAGFGRFSVKTVAAQIWAFCACARRWNRPGITRSVFPAAAAPADVRDRGRAAGGGGYSWFAINGGRVDILAAVLAGFVALILLVQVRLIPLYRRAPFGPGYWAFSFPFAAVTYGLHWQAAGPVEADGNVLVTEDSSCTDSHVGAAPGELRPGSFWNRDGPGMSLNDIAVNPLPGGLRLSTRFEDDYTIATLIGELDVACTPVLREQLLAVLTPRARRLVVDLSGVSFCDASGLAVLVSTGRRATLLGGLLRLAAPSPPVAVALHVSGLLRQFDIFPTVAAATNPLRLASRVPGASGHAAPRGTADPSGPRGSRDSQGPRISRATVTSEKRSLPCSLTPAHGAMPIRRFTVPPEALARAQANHDHTGLASAARSLLAALTRYPIAYSAEVAATACDLRRLIGSTSSSPVLS
jgi:anti-anti-sigma factor